MRKSSATRNEKSGKIENYLSENLEKQEKKLKRELARQHASKTKIITEEGKQDLKYWKSQSLLTQSKREELVASLQVFRKGFEMLGDEIMESDTEKTYYKT